MQRYRPQSAPMELPAAGVGKLQLSETTLQRDGDIVRRCRGSGRGRYDCPGLDRSLDTSPQTEPALWPSQKPWREYSTEAHSIEIGSNLLTLPKPRGVGTLDRPIPPT